MIRKRTHVALFALLFAPLLPASGPPAYRNWDRSPEAYFLTRAERKEWAAVRTDQEGASFIERYWLRRDPTPSTPRNEFREEVARRIGAADEQFTMTRQKGATSTRGKLLIVLGPPTHFTKQRAEERRDQTANVRSPRDLAVLQGRDRTLVQTWIYKKDRLDPSLGLGDIEVRIQIDPERGMDEPLSSARISDVLARMAANSVVNPDALTPADFAGSGAVAPAMIPISGTAGFPAAARAVLEGFLREKRESPGSFWAAPFRTGAGERSYFLQFSVPAELAPERARFGGSVVSREGREIIGFWEEGPLSQSGGAGRSSRIFERAIALPPGEYVGEFGLFSPDGKNLLAAAKESFAVEPFTEAFGVSPLILATNVVRIDTSSSAPGPFLFGSQKPFQAQPKGDRLFSPTDSLWYFLTLENPLVAADADGAVGRPRVLLKISVSKEGKPAFAPFSNVAELEPLGPGLYAAGSEIPLAGFQPGRYTLSVSARDLNAPRDSPAWKGIDRQAPFIVLTPSGALP